VCHHSISHFGQPSKKYIYLQSIFNFFFGVFCRQKQQIYIQDVSFYHRAWLFHCHLCYQSVSVVFFTEFRLTFLSIATPPNAMIFVTGNMRTRDLLKAGFGMKLIGVMVIFFASLVLLSPIFHIQDIISVPNTTLMSNIINS
jgi:hypothetical protein